MSKSVNATSICRLLRRVRFSRQRMPCREINSSRSQFVSDVLLYDSDMLIFLDESGSEKGTVSVANNQ